MLNSHSKSTREIRKRELYPAISKKTFKEVRKTQNELLKMGRFWLCMASFYQFLILNILNRKDEQKVQNHSYAHHLDFNNVVVCHICFIYMFVCVWLFLFCFCQNHKLWTLRHFTSTLVVYIFCEDIALHNHKAFIIPKKN